jgi:S1-C subfamily serine protease
VKVGTEVMPGIVLDSVFARHVLLRRQGVVEKIEFEERAPPAGAGGIVPVARALPSPGRALGARTVPGVQPAPAAQPLPAPAEQFRLTPRALNPNTTGISRSELNQSLQDPKQLANLGRVDASPGGGIGIQEVPPGSLLEKLGLQQGDVVRSLNGVPVNSQADLMRLYQQLGQVGQVRVDGMRAGGALQLNYNIGQ